MRWLPYFILAYTAIGLQIGLSGFTRVGGAAPNLAMLIVVFIAVNAPRDSALLGCFCIGVLQDLVTQQPLGLNALAYGLTAMFIVSTQQVVYREHPLTHFSLALIGGLFWAVVVILHGWFYPLVRVSPAALFSSALYTAILAPFVLWPLQKIKKLFAFESPRRRMRMK